MRGTWSDIAKVERDAVITVLRREAERRELEAERMQMMAERLDRPSLVEASEMGADAFWAAIALLETASR